MAEPRKKLSTLADLLDIDNAYFTGLPRPVWFLGESKDTCEACNFGQVVVAAKIRKGTHFGWTFTEGGPKRGDGPKWAAMISYGDFEVATLDPAHVFLTEEAAKAAHGSDECEFASLRLSGPHASAMLTNGGSAWEITSAEAGAEWVVAESVEDAEAFVSAYYTGFKWTGRVLVLKDLGPIKKAKKELG